jgi:hypothetical protein
MRPVIVAPAPEAAELAQAPDLSDVVDFGSVRFALAAAPPGSGAFDEDLASRRRISGARPFMNTLVGYHTAAEPTGVTEIVHARYSLRLLLESWNRGIERTYLLGLFDLAGEDLAWKRVGLVRPDGTRKPAYAAIANAIALLKDPGADARDGSLPLAVTTSDDAAASDVHHTVLQKSDGAFYVALWREIASSAEESPAQVVVRVGAPITSVQSFDLLGSGGSRPLTADRAGSGADSYSSVALPVSDSPIVLRIVTACP